MSDHLSDACLKCAIAYSAILSNFITLAACRVIRSSSWIIDVVELQSQEAQRKVISEMAEALVSIADLPDGILEPILLSACVKTRGLSKVISESQIETLSRVCTRWHNLLLSSYKRASFCYCRDAKRMLQGLQRVKHVTHVSVGYVSRNRHLGKILRGLATGFPLLTSFDLLLTGDHKVLDRLSSFLSVKTNIQELLLKFYTNCISTDSCNRKRYQKALEDFDFTSQVHLKKLTLDCTGLSPFFDGLVLDGCCFPFSRSLAQLASLQELHIVVNGVGIPFPLWLAKVPACCGLYIQGYHGGPPSFADSLGSLTGLRKLAISCAEIGRRSTAPIINVEFVAAMSQLASLQLDMEGRSVRRLSLSPTLRELGISGHAIPTNATRLPLLEDLTLHIREAIQPDYFAFTPSLRKLKIYLMEGVAWPHLEYLTQLTSLCLLYPEAYGDMGDHDEPVWHLEGVAVPEGSAAGSSVQIAAAA
eukprot:jgi/Mesen1/7253/ME000373S06319